MSERFEIPVAFWRVQYQLLGGHRRIFAFGLGYAGIVVVALMGFGRYFDKMPLRLYVGNVLPFMAALQMLCLLFGSSNAVYRSMLRDYQSKMIESHRLTPMSHLSVTLGYMFGSTVQLVVLWSLTALIGAGLVVLAGLPLGAWFAGNVLILGLAIMVWSLAVFAGMRQGKPLSLGALIALVMLGSAALSFIPGFALLAGSYSGLLGYVVMAGWSGATLPSVCVLTGLNLVLATYWILAAAAKYRRPDMPALNAFRGLVFLTLALLLAAGGLAGFGHIAQAGGRFFAGALGRDLMVVQWLGTLCGMLMLASVVVACATECRRLVANGALARDRVDRTPPALVIVIGVSLICGVLGFVAKSFWMELLLDVGKQSPTLATMAYAWILTAAVAILVLATVRGVHEVAATWTDSASILTAVFVLALWAAPPIVDSVRALAMTDLSESAEYSWLMGFSPAGTLAGAWRVVSIPIWPGMAFQSSVAIAACLVARRGTKSTRS